jgi:hypothetical protein
MRPAVRCLLSPERVLGSNDIAKDCRHSDIMSGLARHLGAIRKLGFSIRKPLTTREQSSSRAPFKGIRD